MLILPLPVGLLLYVCLFFLIWKHMIWKDISLWASVVALSVKKSACSAGDPSLIPESGRSPGEGIVYALQYSWVSLVSQMVKNPTAIQQTWVRSLGQEDPLEEGMARHSSSLAQKIPWTEKPGGLQSIRSQSWTRLNNYACRVPTVTPHLVYGEIIICFLNQR